MSPLWPLRKPAAKGSVEQHGIAGSYCWWSFHLYIPYPSLGVTARQLAGFLSGYWEGRGLTVGWVGMPPEEEPLLSSYAPRRDLLARRLLTCTVENPTHTFPQLWLLLPAGLFLAQVVDPYQVPRVSRERLIALVSSGLAAEALFLGPQFSRRSFNLFGTWVQPRGLRRWVVEQIRRLTAS